MTHYSIFQVCNWFCKLTGFEQQPRHHLPHQHQTKRQSHYQESFSERILGSGRTIRSMSCKETWNFWDCDTRRASALQNCCKWPSLGRFSPSVAVAFGSVHKSWRWSFDRSHFAGTRYAIGSRTNDSFANDGNSISTNNICAQADSTSNASPEFTSILLAS